MTHNKKRDPATDTEATIRDFVFRLRHMGYLGNIRAEFPIYTPDDVRWLATLMATAQAELLAIVRSMPPCGGRVHEPLRHVLAARGVIAKLDQELKLNTSHAAAKVALAEDRMEAAHHG